MTTRLDRRLLAPRHWSSWVGVSTMRVVSLLPLSVSFALGRALGATMYHLLTSRRHIAEVNIGLCFPELSDTERRALVRRVFASTGLSAIETALAFFRAPERYRSRTTIEGLEHLDTARSLGRGVVLVGAHFATLDLAGALLSLYTDFDVIYRHNRNPVIEHTMRAGRQRLYEGVIERGELKRALESLKRGRTLWYAADQDYGEDHSVFAPFFGIPAATITMPARLARVNDSPVLFYSHFRDPVSRCWRLRLSAPLDGYPTADPIADATRINRMIEAEIRSHPDQYLWLHRRFKTRPAGVDRPYRVQPHKHRRARRPSGAN